MCLYVVGWDVHVQDVYLALILLHTTAMIGCMCAHGKLEIEYFLTTTTLQTVAMITGSSRLKT